MLGFKVHQRHAWGEQPTITAVVITDAPAIPGGVVQADNIALVVGLLPEEFPRRAEARLATHQGQGMDGQCLVVIVKPVQRPATQVQA